MRKPILVSTSLLLLLVACGGDGPSRTSFDESPTPSPREPSPSASERRSASGWDPYSITGTAVLSAWRSSPEEGEALTQALLGFPTEYPKIEVDYQPIAGDYRTVMIARISDGDVPDLFAVKDEYAPEWIAEGFLLPLDDYIERSGFETGQFFEGYMSAFQAQGQTYGVPRDGDTIAMAYNSAIVTTPPTSMGQLLSTAEGLKGKPGLTAPMCLNPGLDPGLAFLYAQGGDLTRPGESASAIETQASMAAVQWYMDLFKNGLAKTASDLGAGWCGEALGQGQVAFVFEGGWLDALMTSAYPDIAYAWAEMPVGSSGSPVTISYTESYSIGAESMNKDQAFVLLSYLTGRDGMTTWTKGGVALPSRQDVPVPDGKEVLVAGGAYARPASGFMPGYVDVKKAFQEAFIAQIQDRTYDRQAVVDATKAAIDMALR